MKGLLKWSVESLAYMGFGAWGLQRRTSGRREAPDLDGVDSILVIRLNLLGDLLFTLPAVAALRRAAPRARITMLVLPYTSDLLESSGLVDRIVVADVNDWRRPRSWLDGSAARGIREVLRQLRESEYDLAVSFYGRVGSAFAVASGAAHTAGYGAEGYPFSFDLALPGRRYESGGHEAEYCLEVARALGAASAAALPVLAPDSPAAARVDALLAEAGIGASDRIVALHPGALNMAAKRWLPGRWAAVADRIQGELGARVALVGSSAEVALAEVVRRDMSTSPLMLTGRTSIPELTELLRRSRLFLGGDSGPLHLASALGVPSVSIFGPTAPANTGPLSPCATVLRGDAACIPCYRLDRPATCWRGDLLCMTQVTASQVFEAVREKLSSGEARANSHQSSVISPEVSGFGFQVSGEGPDPDLSSPGRAGGLSPAARLGEEACVHQDRPYPDPLPGGEGDDRALPGGEGDLSNTQHPTPNTYSLLITHYSSPTPSTQFNRILVVKLAGIGDLLTAFPAMEALRRRFPLAAISALVTPQSASVLEGQGLVDDLILLDKYVFDSPGGFAQVRSVTGLASLSRRLRARSFDAVVLLHHLVTWSGVAKYAALTGATGARTIAGLDDGRGWFLNLAARDAGFGSKHEVEYWLDVVALLGADHPAPGVVLRWGSAEDGYADSAWKTLGLATGSPVVAIHPGTGSYSPARRWAPERFAVVGRSLAADGFTPVLVAGPGEEDLAGQVAGALPRPLVLTGAPTPRHLAAFLARCRLLVGNDSGVSHVGAAAGVPVVAVFGPSNHRAWAPYDSTGRRVRVVRVELPCGPCLYRGQSLGMRNGCGDPRCLDLIGAEPVLRTAREMVRQGPETC